MTTKKLTTTILSLLLSVSTAFGSSVVAAEEAAPEEPAQASETIEEVPAEEGTEEPAEETAEEKQEEPGTEVNEDTEPAEEVPAEKVPAEEPAETETPEVPEDGAAEEAEPAEAAEEEPVEEATEEEQAEEEQEEDTFSIPAGFEIRPMDIEGKQLLIENGIPEDLYTMTEGVDYSVDELVMVTDSREYAEQTAEIYGGELKSFNEGVAVIILPEDGMDVAEAFAASLNDERLPLVEPNYKTYLEPAVSSEEEDLSYAQVNEALPEVKDWNDWVKETFSNPDPFLLDPTVDDMKNDKVPYNIYLTQADADLAKNYQWFHEQVNTYAGWNATMGKNNVLVAVIDQGVNPNHEDLKGRVTVYETSGCESGFADGHGTHVAGIIAASANNGLGGAGIAPNVKIASINVFHYETINGRQESVARKSDIIEGLNKSVSLKADCVNMSLGGYYYDYYYEQAVKNAYNNGITICAAAGNDGTNIKSYPAAFADTICVASTTRNGSRAYYSNYGSWVDISAPGSDIYSTCSTKAEPGNSRYEIMSGTSMATPVVTGAVALYMSKFGHVAPAAMKKVLKASTVKCSSPQMGAGILSIEKMFSGDKAAPEIKVYASNGSEITSLNAPVSAGSYFMINNTDAGNNDVILYTTNGKKPAIKDGVVVTGDVYTAGQKIYLSAFEQSATIKVNAAVVNSFGVLGNVKTVSIKTPVPAAQTLKIKTVKLDNAKATLTYGSGRGTSIQLNAESLINTAGANVSLNSVSHQWVSSDTSIATVSSSGRVTAKGPGTVKITLKMLDGSNKKAVCTVTVNQLVESMTVTGFATMAAGSSTSYKVDVLPAKAKDKKVVWSKVSGPEGVSVTEAGKVTVDKSVAPGASFTIKATAADGSGKSATKVVRVGEKVTAVSLSATTDSKDKMPLAEKNAKGVLTTVQLFTTPLSDSLHNNNENKIRLIKSITGGNVEVIWKSSNTKVATVDSNGNVTAVGAGTAKITCTANDASKKSASVNVKVLVPVSSVDMDLGLENILGAGKSLKLANKVSYGTAHGKPTNTKMNYSIKSVKYAATADATPVDKTSAAVTQKLVTVDKNGTLKTDKNITSLGELKNGALTVIVKAEAADGSGYSSEATVLVKPAVTVLDLRYSTSAGYYVVIDSPVNVSVTSGNPNILGGFASNYQKSGTSFYYKNKYYNGYAIPISFGAPEEKSGKAAITIKALDGSNKSFKITFNVK